MRVFLLSWVVVDGVVLIALAGLIIVGLVALVRRRLVLRLARVRRVAIAARTDVTPSLMTLTLRADDDEPLPAFEAGQHVKVYVEFEDGRRVARRYSLASWSPDASTYELGVRCVPGGLVSAALFETALVDTTVKIGPPRGGFVLRPLKEGRTVLLVGGGIGITPLRAMWQALLERATAGVPVVLCHGAETPADLLWHDELATAAAQHKTFRYLPRVQHPVNGWQGATGVWSAGELAAVVDDPTVTTAYLCGPAKMLTQLRAEMPGRGFVATDIHDEAFTLGEAPGGDYALSVRGRTFRTAGAPTLLHALEAAGFAVENDCRAGTCGSCRCRLAHGTVEWLVEPGAPLDDGEILACACRPTSDLAVVLP